MEIESELLRELRQILGAGDNDIVPLRELIESLPVGIVYVDANEVIRVVNKEIERWYAMPRSQILGRTVDDLTERSEADDERGRASRLALSGHRATFFMRRRHPDGQYRYVCSYLQPDVAVTGKVIGYIGVFCPVPLGDEEAALIFDEQGMRRAGNAGT